MYIERISFSQITKVKTKLRGKLKKASMNKTPINCGYVHNVLPPPPGHEIFLVDTRKKVVYQTFFFEYQNGLRLMILRNHINSNEGSIVVRVFLQTIALPTQYILWGYRLFLRLHVL